MERRNHTQSHTFDSFVPPFSPRSVPLIENHYLSLSRKSFSPQVGRQTEEVDNLKQSAAHSHLIQRPARQPGPTEEAKQGDPYVTR